MAGQAQTVGSGRQDVTWQKNASSQIVLDSIFAALAALWITVTLHEHANIWVKAPEVACALVSFYFLAMSAEGTVTAWDEKDVVKYLYYLLWYNVGVVLLDNSIGLVISVHFYERFLKGWKCWTESSPWLHWPLLVGGYLLVAAILQLGWIYDAWWLRQAPEEEFNKYCDELNDLRLPERVHGRLMRRIFGHRLRYGSSPPA